MESQKKEEEIKKQKKKNLTQISIKNSQNYLFYIFSKKWDLILNQVMNIKEKQNFRVIYIIKYIVIFLMDSVKHYMSWTSNILG